MKRLAKIVGVVTLPPVIGGTLLTLLYFLKCDGFQDKPNYWLALAFIVFLPLLAYPLHAALPKLKKGGRESQRKTAMVLAPLSYTAGLIFALLIKAPYGYITFYLSYVLSLAFLLFMNGVLKIRASGHACGVTGPLLLCVYYVGSFGWLGFLLLPVVYWARLTHRRHTPKELFFGTLAALLGTMIAMLAV